MLARYIRQVREFNVANHELAEARRDVVACGRRANLWAGRANETLGTLLKSVTEFVGTEMDDVERVIELLREPTAWPRETEPADQYVEVKPAPPEETYDALSGLVHEPPPS